jgi:hypothetical protein
VRDEEKSVAGRQGYQISVIGFPVGRREEAIGGCLKPAGGKDNFGG